MVDEDHHDVPKLDLQHVKILSVLGRGAKGVVFRVRTELTDEPLALKLISKALIEKKKKDKNTSDGSEYKRICFERDVLRQFQHPLLPKLRGVVDTENIIGYAIDYCPGRDLNSLRKKQTEKMFSDDIIRFYAAELVLALEYLHGLGIGYRDLKPENIMIQENGHLMLVDFDLSTKLSRKSPEANPIAKSAARSEPVKRKRVSPFQKCCDSVISPDDSVTKSNSFVGTEEYVAPEIILGDGHDFAVDWWSLGVVLYEMLYGTTPFRGSDRKETFYRILRKTPELVGEPTPLRDLIGKLLEKDAKQRISLEEIKGHNFFKGIQWDLVVRISRPPHVPVAPENVEDTDGIKGTDVESFVQGIFKGAEDQTNKCVENNDKENVNKGLWVEGRNHPSEANNFLVF
ncbi:hypothetical protein L1049_004688 [Liquidambar formosana]|uniref:non-specific serine/threonine protein kinase n=1 Tax=Liquidambar formosana TaxID=63359 RepID=A0AAP0WWE3_LIQFO